MALALGTIAAQSNNGCALLKVSEIQAALAPNVRIAEGVAKTDPLSSLVCVYKWGTGGNAVQLQVINGDATKMWPGTSPALIKQGVLGAAQPKVNGVVIPGVGEAAVFTSDSPFQAKANAYLKNRFLIVSLEESNARAKKDQVIALLKSAAARL